MVCVSCPSFNYKESPAQVFIGLIPQPQSIGSKPLKKQLKKTQPMKEYDGVSLIWAQAEIAVRQTRPESEMPKSKVLGFCPSSLVPSYIPT